MTYVPDKSRYDTMQYRRCGRSGLLLPAISLGLWHNFGAVDSFGNVQAMLRRAFDLGITHFDLANKTTVRLRAPQRKILAAFSTAISPPIAMSSLSAPRLVGTLGPGRTAIGVRANIFLTAWTRASSA